LSPYKTGVFLFTFLMMIREGMKQALIALGKISRGVGVVVGIAGSETFFWCSRWVGMWFVFVGHILDI